MCVCVCVCVCLVEVVRQLANNVRYMYRDVLDGCVRLREPGRVHRAYINMRQFSVPASEQPSVQLNVLHETLHAQTFLLQLLSAQLTCRRVSALTANDQHARDVPPDHQPAEVNSASA